MADSSNLFRRALLRRVAPTGAPIAPRAASLDADAGRYAVVCASPQPSIVDGTLVAPSTPRRFALVVEDDDVVRDGIATVLDDAGFKVVETATLDHARTLLDAMRPSVLVLDFNLAGEYASVLLDELRHRRCTTPILLVSASPLAIDAARAFGLELLPKPVEIDALVERVERLASGGGAAVKAPAGRFTR
ncbi:MAG: hypothetical protein NVSMB47_04690 [Polyangiales bacterium]